jgi:hypothetical protein
MINFKIDTNADLWAIEVPKKGGGFMVTTYPRNHKCMPVSNDSFQIISLTNTRLYFGKIADYTVANTTYTDVNEFATALNGVIYIGAGSSGSSNIDFTPLIDKLDEVIQNDDENTTNIIDAINTNALIEFDVTMDVPASSDAEYEITPIGTEIRDYQIFEVSNPTQDITSDVSSAVIGTNKIRIFTTLPLSIKIIGTRTQV